AFDPGGDVDAVAKDVLALDDDIADIDPDPEPNRIVDWDIGIALAQLSLDFDSASDCIDGAGEFHQHAVAHELDDTSRMRADCWIDQRTTQGIQTRQRPSLIHAHKARVADHIGRHNCRKPPLKAFLCHE